MANTYNLKLTISLFVFIIFLLDSALAHSPYIRDDNGLRKNNNQRMNSSYRIIKPNGFCLMVQSC